MGQQLSLAAEGQESTANYMAQNSDSVTMRSQSQREGHPGQSQSYSSGLSEQNSNLVSQRQLGPRKSVVTKESPPTAIPVVSTSPSSVSTAATSAALVSRASRNEADLGRMSVREAIDSFIESRLSAPNDSPPPTPVPTSFGVKGLKNDDSRSSSKPGEDSMDKTGSDRVNGMDAHDISLCASKSASDDSNRKDTPQTGAEGKENGASTNEALDEESERMSDMELVIDCDATESPQSATGRSESLPPSKEREGSGVAPKNSAENLSPINLSETKDVSVKDKSDADKSAGDDEKKHSPSAKEEKQSFSSYLQDRLKAQLASHVDTEAQGHLYLWDVNKSNPVSSALPVTSTITRTGSVRLQTLLDKVLDQSIGKGLGASSSESDSSHLFVPAKPSSESSSSPSDNNKSIEQSPSAQSCPNKAQNNLMKFDINSLCFKDHIEKVVVQNFLSYEQEEGERLKSDTRQTREESAASAVQNPTTTPNSDLDYSKANKETGGVGPDGTISVQHIVDRVISQTEVISKLLTPGAADQTSERMSPGRGSGGRSVSSSSPSSVSSAPSRSNAGGHASSEGQPTGGGSGQPSIGRKRGRPRLSSPVSRPNTWSSDRNPVSVGERSNVVFRDPQTGDYRATSSALLHGRQGGPSVPPKPHPRLAQGQGPPSIDMITSQGSIQHGLPIGALVPQQPAAHMYHSQLHPHHPHAQQHPSSENPNFSARPVLTSSIPPPHSPHLTSYHQRGLHHPGPHAHGPQPPSPHGHPQHHHRPPDHLTNHHPPHNKPLPPLIHANHIQERHVVSNNSTSIASGSSAGSRVNSSGGVGSSRLVPVSHIPTASCSCPNCVAIYSRDKPLQVPPSSSHHQQHIRRGEAGMPSHMPSSKLSDARRDDPRSHPHHPQPYAVYENATALASRGEHLTAPAPETLNPVVAVGSKVIPPSAIIPSFIAARRPVGLPPALEPHPREEQRYSRDDKSAHYPSQGKPTSSEAGYPEDERYRAWQRAQASDPHSSQPSLPYPPYDHARKASAHGHGRQSPENAPHPQPQPLDLQKGGYQHPEAPLASSSSPANADQPLDLSVKPSSSSDHKNREQEVHRPPPTLRNEAFYQDPAVGQRYASSHGPQREPDPRDTYTDVDGAGRGPLGRPDNTADRLPHPVHAYPPGHRAFSGPPSSHPLVAQYPPQAGPKAPPLHPSQVYLSRGDCRSNAQAASERPPYPTSGHLLSPSNPAANSRESPTQRSRHPYTHYPLPPPSSSSSSPSPSLQLQQQQPTQQPQPQHPAAAQPPSLSIPPHLRGNVGASPGSNAQYQRRSPYSDQIRQPKHQDPRAPSPHYSSVGSHQKTPDNYPVLAGSQDTAEIRGVHSNLPPPHPQPGVSPDDQDALKHCVSKHEPIQNIIGNHPQNDILYLICKLCRQTYGSPYGFRKHFRNQHGFEPKVEHTIVQTISATKTAMAHTGPADQPMTDVEKKRILYSDSQGPQTADGPVLYKSEYSSSPLVMDKHPQDVAAAHGKVPDDHKTDLKAESKALDGKMEAVLENTKFLECPECGQTFQLNDFGSYKRHCRQHSVNQYSGPFSCHDCQKSFAEPGQLQQHLNTHKSFTPSLCGFCPTFFSSPHYLAVHLQAAHGHVVSSESLKKSSNEPELKPEVKNEKHNTLDLHTMIQNALMEINVPHTSQPVSNTNTKTSLSSAHNVASSSSHHEHAPVVSSSISSLPLSKRHRMSVASSNSPVLTTVHTPKKLEVQKLPADAVVTTASPDSSYEEGKGQPAESQARLSTSALKSGYKDLAPSPSNCSNISQSQGEAKEPAYDSQDSNHSTSLASGGLKKDESGSRTGQTDIPMSMDKVGSNKDDTESITSDRCQSVDSNSQSVGESRASSPGCDGAEKFYKHKKYSRHRKRMSSSDVPSEVESKTPKLSTSTTTYDNDQTSAGSVSSTNNANTVVQVCESSSGHYECKSSASNAESSCSSQEDGGSGKMASKSGTFEKNAKESRQEDSGMYGGKSSSDGSKKGEGVDGITKYKWDRLTRSQTGKSPQAVSYSNS